MFEFLKKLFSKEIEKASVNLKDLDKWFEDKTKHYNSELAAYIKQKVSEIELIKKEVENANKELEEAVPQDEEKIMPKVRNVVEGARKNYMRQITQLMKEIRVEKEDVDYISQFCKTIQQKFDLFAQATTKSFYTTQHLFHKQVEVLAQHIKNLDKTIGELNESIKKSKSAKAKQIKTKISQLNKNTELLAGWKDSVSKFEEQKQELINQENKIQQQIQELKESKEYKEYEQDLEQLKILRDSLKKKSDEIFELIAPLETALKKYERITLDNQKVVKRYVENLVQAFIEDKSMMLLELLGKLKSSIEKGSLDLKDKKKEKTIKIIDSIEKEQLEKMQKDYLQTQQKIEETKDRIDKSDVKIREEGLLKKKQKTKDEIANIERETNETKEMIAKIDLEKGKKEIIDKIRDLIDVEVNLE